MKLAPAPANIAAFAARTLTKKMLLSSLYSQTMVWGGDIPKSGQLVRYIPASQEFSSFRKVPCIDPAGFQAIAKNPLGR
jgi:hypothetical protein